MKLTAQETVQAPREAVWAKVTDFGWLEGLAASHAEITRVGDRPQWRVVVDWHGMKRDLDVQVRDMQPSETLVFEGLGHGVAAEVAFRLTELGPEQTRVAMNVSLRGKSLAGKMIVQGLNLGRGSIEEKLQSRMTGFAKTMAQS